jgi:NAD(P)-dependent dehydrogenase (short-subunit alcohol dehydrogenase family)
VDMTDPASVAAMFDKAGLLDAVVSAAGDVEFSPLEQFTPERFMATLQSKLMGQINLVLAGLGKLSDGGSFTLTSGILDREPIRTGASAAAANGGLAGFVKGAAIEMPRGLRINVVSPGLLEASAAKYGSWFPGHEPVSSRRVGLAYARGVEGAASGQVITVD